MGKVTIIVLENPDLSEILQAMAQAIGGAAPAALAPGAPPAPRKAPLAPLGADVICPVCSVDPDVPCVGVPADTPVRYVHPDRARQDPDYAHIKRFVGKVSHADALERPTLIRALLADPGIARAVRRTKIPAAFRLVYSGGVPAKVRDRFTPAGSERQLDAADIGRAVHSIAAVLNCLP